MIIFRILLILAAFSSSAVPGRKVLAIPMHRSIADLAWAHEPLLDTSGNSISQHTNVHPSISLTRQASISHLAASDQYHHGQQLQQVGTPSLARSSISPLHADKGKSSQTQASTSAKEDHLLQTYHNSPQNTPSHHGIHENCETEKEKPWKDVFSGQVMKMSKILANHLGKNKVTAYRLLSKYGNYDIAKDLLSGVEVLEREAAAKFPGYKGKVGIKKVFGRKEGRIIIEKYMKMHGLTRKQAIDKLGVITPSISEKLKDPYTFEETARNLTVRPKRTKSQMKAEALLEKATPSAVEDGANTVKSYYKADDPDYIDFDAVMEFVRSRSNKDVQN
jgi:hypothetical protein